LRADAAKTLSYPDNHAAAKAGCHISFIRVGIRPLCLQACFQRAIVRPIAEGYSGSTAAAAASPLRESGCR